MDDMTAATISSQNQSLFINNVITRGIRDVPWTGDIAAVGPIPPSVSNVNNSNPFWDAASMLAFSPYSRYRYEGDGCDVSTSRSSLMMNVVRSDPKQSRHVLWDDEESEEEEEEQQGEDPNELSRRKERAFNQWNTSTAEQLRQQLSAFPSSNTTVAISDASAETLDNKVPPSSPPSSSSFEQALAWRDFWMPPRSERSIVSLPFSHQSSMIADWEDAYTVEGLTGLGKWTEDVLFESLRHLLEASDGCQGFSITTQGQGIYAGLTSALLDEIQHECKSTGRLVYHVINPSESPRVSIDTNDSTSHTEEEHEEQNSWQAANVRRVRTQIGSGLALHDFSEKSHVVLPLHLDHDLGSLFRASARLAVALEASSLPFRLRGNNRNGNPRRTEINYGIGLQNAPFFGTGGSDFWWGTAAKSLTFTEYISMLRPSSSYPILELDALSKNTITKSDLWRAIRSGTSVERDERMRQTGEHGLRGRPQDCQPGVWLEDAQIPPGLLSSLSYPPALSNTVSNRSAHHHFSLSSSARPLLLESTSHENAHNGSSALSDCLSCFIQGMGIKYRPERSMATIVDKSIRALTFGGDGAGYGAGAYWKHLLPSIDCPVVSILGNTTRSYVSLRETATNMRTSMGSRSRGYVNRDIINGVLPEKEDCDEALVRVWDLCDTYAPPSGTGFDSDGSG
jgi:hypothetical protein